MSRSSNRRARHEDSIAMLSTAESVGIAPCRGEHPLPGRGFSGTIRKMSIQQSSEHPASKPQAPGMPRWIALANCAVNLAQVCRIEYRRRDVPREEIDGFDLYLAGGTAVHAGAERRHGADRAARTGNRGGGGPMVPMANRAILAVRADPVRLDGGHAVWRRVVHPAVDPPLARPVLVTSRDGGLIRH